MIHNDLKACGDYANGLASAARVQCPTLLILGERDIMTPPGRARDLARGVAGARTAVLAGSGHSLLSEQPDAVLDELITAV